MAHVVSALNDYMNVRSPSLSTERVVSGSLFDLDGKVNTETRDKVALSIVNVEEDRVYRSVEIFERRADGKSLLVKPEVKVNLYVLFVANLGKYDEALKALGQIVAFFQSHSSFDYASVPALAGREGRVVFELFSMSFEQQNHLWGALGAKYMPSVMYKAGIVDVRDERVEGVVPPVEEVWVNE
jgi:hypothetical protein